MELDKEKISKAKIILEKMANGINPINGEPINDESFLQDPRMIRCLFFISGVLQEVINSNGKVLKSTKPQSFSITKEEKMQVVIPDRNIGITEFTKCINSVIDLNRSKKLSPVEVNKQLKKMGILGEEITEKGNKRTVINEKSKEYGIEMESRNFNGKIYDVVVFNEEGKKFLLENLEDILNY